ncbi:NAD(P)H-dependent FMN reductase [Catalinimonas alkaloidigena]|uniref:NAD(P)H-dependent FMN reductase n=1 Tax=Catalinimonas alkaloidigena TaxID=1075417 RepID=A0A1G8XMV6_9BACT|nr:NAD(P)H-dependent oxidoreductase [Catalinimonas alkaloidigena]SDJ91756.1 NAD(P)H-dependent FMN reductase [Catalinimonas alkaloidigena]
MLNLKIITSTVRPGRKGPLVAEWIAEQARQYGGFEVEVLDLGAINLPLMNEPVHPIMRQYEHEHTKQWSATIDEADAFVFVTAEYDYSYPAPLKNALEYLVHEWNYKPAGIVSYGGVSAGTRAANTLKNDLATLRIVPLMESVNFPMFTQFVNEQGEFVPNEVSHKATETMLRELTRWAKGLAMIKENRFEEVN